MNHPWPRANCGRPGTASGPAEVARGQDWPLSRHVWPTCEHPPNARRIGPRSPDFGHGLASNRSERSRKARHGFVAGPERREVPDATC